MATAIQHVTDCPICYEPFTAPKILPCDHSLCTACINRIQQDQTIKCPMCNVYHDADSVRADFRLTQFLDALKEKQQVEGQSIQPKGATSKSCELCSTNPVTFMCEDCQQWICTLCKNMHLKSAVCKDHKVTPLALKNQEVKDTFKIESRKVKDKIEDFSKAIENLETKSSNVDAIKNAALQTSSKLKQSCLEDMTKFFDAFDNKIIEFAQQNAEELQTKKSTLEGQAKDLQSNWQQLEEMVQENPDELAVQASSILDKAKILVKSTGDFSSEMNDMLIKVLPGITWDASTAATLQMRIADMQVAPCHLTTRNLAELTKGTFRKHQEISLERSPKALRLIKEELWSCQDSGNIQIFDQYLEHQRSISNDAWGNVYDVALLSNDQLVLACSNGLFHIDPSGEQINTIDTGFFSSAIYHENKLYTYTCSPARICAYVLNGDWRKDGTINLRCGDWHFVTLSVTKQHIMAGYAYEGKIYEISMKGEILNRYGERRKDATLDWHLGLPFLCQHDKEDSLLTADFDHHRLLVLDKQRHWKWVKVKPQLVCPRGAVYTGHTLYVASTGRVYTLSAYTQE